MGSKNTYASDERAYALVQVSPRKYSVIRISGQMSVMDGVELIPGLAKHGDVVCGPTTYEAAKTFLINHTRPLSINDVTPKWDEAT